MMDNTEDNKVILLVDDDPTFLHMAKSWLDEKFKVIMVSSGMQALAFISKNVPCLILLDYEMPGMTGPEVLKKIRTESRTPDIPVFFLTGKTDNDAMNALKDLNPLGFIIKTGGKDELVSKVEEFFRGRQF